ncbi:hypothetical protein WJX72_003175 [[Myrmecia] bisecta]|uniref:Uncharacterized protein n=1 Tax=[Myrmecia] bisecta TaxID=41462 RepID=A0AAW1R5C2_9CHLO
MDGGRGRGRAATLPAWMTAAGAPGAPLVQTASPHQAVGVPGSGAPQQPWHNPGGQTTQLAPPAAASFSPATAPTRHLPQPQQQAPLAQARSPSQAMCLLRRVFPASQACLCQPCLPAPVFRTASPAPSPAVGQATKPKPEWTEHTAPGGRKYYYNSVTKQSSWEKPQALLAPEERVAQTDWKEYTSPDGRKYYHNRATKESRWTMPDELKRAKEAAAGGRPTPTRSPAVTPQVQVVRLDSPAGGAVPNGQAAAPQSTVRPAAAAGRSEATAEASATPQDDKKFMYSTKEEAKDAFKELLASVHTASDWSWEQTMRLIISDRRYSALKSLGEKKACFNEYLQQRAREEKEEARRKAKQTRDDFTALLEETPDLRPGSRFSKARDLLAADPRWKAVADDKERSELFDTHMKERERREREENKARRKQKVAAFRDLLERTPAIKVDTPWRKAQAKLEGEAEYDDLDKIERLEAFQDYIRELERVEKEKKEKAKEERRRKERKTRDRFKDLLKRHRQEGIITAKTRWKEYFKVVKGEEALAAVERNSSGSRPKELFEDLLEEVEAAYDTARPALKDLAKQPGLTIIPDTVFADWDAAVLAAAPDKLANITKADRRVKRLPTTSSWEQAKPVLEKEPEYKLVDNEGEAQRIFEDWAAGQRVKNYKDKDKKEKSRSHKKDKRSHHSEGEDSGERKHSRHSSKRKHASPEGDGDEKKKSKRHRKDKERRSKSGGPGEGGGAGQAGGAGSEGPGKSQEAGQEAAESPGRQHSASPAAARPASELGSLGSEEGEL